MPGSGSSVEKRKAGRGVSPLLDGLLEGGASVERVYDQIHSLVDNLPAWVALRDLAGDYQLINAYAFEKAGHLAAAATREQTLGRSVSDLFGPDVVAKFKAADEEVLASGQSVAYDMELPGPSGEPRTYEFTTYPVRARDGEILGLGRHGLDVTEIRRERREKEAAQQLLTTSFNYAPAGVALIRIEADGSVGGFERVNPALCKMLGYTEQELLELGPSQLTPPDDLEATAEGVRALLAGEVDCFHADKRYLRADGEPVWVALDTTLVRDEQGTARHFMTQMIDITHRVELEERLRHEAYHDPLTGLLNRRAFESALDRHLGEVEAGRSGGALLAIDIDRLKRVNDTHGHGAGDRLIRSVADVLKSETRAADVVARLSGDEFAVLLADTDAAAVEPVTSQLLSAIAAREIVVSDGLAGAEHVIRATASIGSTLIRSGLLSGAEALARADMALYEAKRSGRGRAAVS